MTSRGISSGAGEENQAGGMSSKTIGRLELTFVALLYGSLTVAFRFLYSLEGPPTVKRPLHIHPCACDASDLLNGSIAPNTQWANSLGFQVAVAFGCGRAGGLETLHW